MTTQTTCCRCRNILSFSHEAIRLPDGSTICTRCYWAALSASPFPGEAPLFPQDLIEMFRYYR